MAMTPHPETAVDPESGLLVVETPTDAHEPDQKDVKPRSMFRRGWEVFAENRLALVGLGFVIFIILFSFVGPLIYKTQQVSVTLADAYCPPSTQHLLGCDKWAWLPRSWPACSARSTGRCPASPAASWTRS